MARLIASGEATSRGDAASKALQQTGDASCGADHLSKLYRATNRNALELAMVCDLLREQALSGSEFTLQDIKQSDPRKLRLNRSQQQAWEEAKKEAHAKANEHRNLVQRAQKSVEMHSFAERIYRNSRPRIALHLWDTEDLRNFVEAVRDEERRIEDEVP